MHGVDDVSAAAASSRSRFVTYLRTGRRVPLEIAVTESLKFNHQHDPANGQFTFANGSNSGRQPFRGGGGASGGGGAGGSFGGGGAGGSWSELRGRSTRPATSVGAGRATKPISITPATPLLRLALPSQLATGWQSTTRNGYKFEIDSAQRTRRVSGTITLNPNQPRSRQTQARAGGTDRLLTDDGGHYIARQFNGPTDAFNHFAQDAGFNRGGYRVLEGKWAKARLQGKLVSVDIVASYNGTSTRPASITVHYRADNTSYIKDFTNITRKK